MTVHIYEHHPAFSSEMVVKEAESEGLRPRVFRLPEGEQPIRDFEGVRALVFCGGPQRVLEVDEYPWLRKELLLCKAAVLSSIPVLGLGLGARILAHALGAEIKPLTYGGERWAEVGWGNVTIAPDAQRAGLLRSFPQRLEVLHWHDETLTLPPGARCLASTPVTPVQAFVHSTRHFGLQFHIELGKSSIERLANEFSPELKRLNLTPLTIAMDMLRRVQALELHASQFLGRFFAMAVR